MFQEKNISFIYAKIIFKIAQENKNFISWEYKLKYFSYLMKIKSLKSIFLSVFNAQDSYKKFISLCNFQLNNLEKEIIKSLFELKKIYLLKKIFKEYKIIKNQYFKNLHIKVISSNVLNKNDRNTIKKNFLKILSNYSIYLNYSVKQDIIGGIIFKVNDLIIDFSIKSQLKSLNCYLLK